MANDISGFGFTLNLKTTVTFPAGVNITQFADDADPFDIPSLQQLDKAMGLNGDMVTWSKANPIILGLSVIAGSDDDRNLQALAEANRVGRGKSSARDVVTLTGIYPNGKQITLIEGKLTDAPPGNSIASAGRLKSKTYMFAFENYTA